MSDLDQRDPYRHTGYLIRRAQQLHVAAWTRHVSSETTSVQYAILAVLNRLGEASQRVLCDEVDLDRSTVADLIKRMERRGLVERRRDPSDARSNIVTLSATGVAEYRRLQPLVELVDEDLASQLSESQLNSLRSTLRAMLR